MIGESITAQVIIKERIPINPEAKKEISQFNITSSTEYLWVQVSGEADWSAILEGPCGASGYAEGAGGSIKFISIANAPVGTYRIILTQYLNYAGGAFQIGYAAGYTGLSSDSASFSYSGVYQIAEGSQTDSLSFDLNYKNDFVVYTAENVCVNKTPGVILNTFKVSDCSKTTPFELWTAVNLSIQSASADIIFYDYASEQSLGKNITVTNTQLSNIILKLNSPFYGLTENATLTAEINGATRSSTVIVEPSTKNFVLNADNDGFHLVHGFSKTITVTASSIGDCNEPFPDSSITYNLEIINGMQFGHLKNMLNGNVGVSLQNIDQIEGSMNFQFIADGEIPLQEETITVRISSSSSGITGTEISFFVNPNDILVTFLPPSIQPTDTTDIVLKMRDTTGVVVDFPEDQSFSLELTDGSDCGDILFLFRGMFWVDAKLLEYAYKPFKFAARDMPLNGSVQTTILVSTDKDGKKLWGSGIITIGKDSSHIAAYFEKSDLAPGDTVNVIVKKVDGNGNETDYPPDTPFEVAIVKGCGLGLINGTSDHLSNIQQPIKFVVADSLTSTDSVVVLRVGAPVVEESVANKTIVNTPALSKAKNAKSNMNIKTAQNANAKILAQTTNEDVCTIYTPIYTNTSDAAATIGGDCDYIPTCTGQSAEPTWTVNSNYKNGDFGFYGCVDVPPPLGYFIPINTNTNTAFEDYLFSICKNSNSKKKEVTFASPIALRAILDYCADNIESYHFIEIPNDNKTVIKSLISEAEAPRAFLDFYHHVQWPLGAKYAVKELIMYHEILHREDYEEDVVKIVWNMGNTFNGNKYLNYGTALKNVVADCKKSNSLNDLIMKTKELQNSILGQLLKDINTKINEIKKDHDEGDVSAERFEKWIKPIRYYQTLLKEIYPNAKYDLKYEM